MQNLDGLLRGEARRDQLASARKAEHQVGLDESQRDVEVGGNEPLVDENGRSRCRVTQVAVLGEFARVVVHDAVLRRHPLPADLPNFRLRRGTVQAGGDQDGDALARNPRRLQPGEQWRQDLAGSAPDA